MRIFTILKKMAQKLGLISDYVVETGTSGIWAYRKWASGTAECWGRWSGNLNHYAGPYGMDFFGYKTGTLAFPFAFQEVPICIQYSCNIGNGFSIGAQGRLSTTKSSMVCYMLANISGRQPVYADICAIGRWK